MRTGLELELKRLVAAQNRHFVTFYEPARGATFGAPDLSMVIALGKLVPVELKAGESDPFIGTVYKAQSCGFRPSQIAWHRDFASVGGIAFGLMGVPSGEPSIPIRQKRYKSFNLFITYGYEIGGNECLWRPVERHSLRQELLKHVAHLESDEGQRTRCSATDRFNRVLPS